MNRLLARAIFAFLALPGVVAFLVPLALLRPPDRPFQPVAIAPLALGVFLLMWCVRDFYVSGKGTLAPWAPPRELVTTGLYRFSRNPMYVSVAIVLWAWALGFHSRALAVYAIVVMVAFHLRVVLNEERVLARAHGDAWQRYTAEVSRWIGRRRGAHDWHQRETR